MKSGYQAGAFAISKVSAIERSERCATLTVTMRAISSPISAFPSAEVCVVPRSQHILGIVGCYGAGEAQQPGSHRRADVLCRGLDASASRYGRMRA